MREERFWSFEKSFPEIRKRKESERELAKRGGRRGRPPGKVGEQKAEAMKPGPPAPAALGWTTVRSWATQAHEPVRKETGALSREPCVATAR